MGVVLIDAFQVCLELLPNFRGKNLVAFCLIFVAEIWQRFNSDASQHTKCYSHQTFVVRMRQWGYPIFTAKIRQSFAFGALWRIGRVLCLCTWHISVSSHRGEPKPSKVSSMLMRVTYTRKPMSLGDMDQDNHTVMVVHTIQHEYAPTTITLSAYPYYRVNSSHKQRGSLMQPRESIIQSAQSSTHMQAYIYIYIHTLCTML